MNNLTTTSYAILGQLALRSWTTYALANEMRRNFRFFWPRAESGIYAEIKRLAESGLVSAEHEYVGKRPRTIYTITPEGRAAFETWLATPIKSASLEFEGLVRIFFGAFVSPEQLTAALEQIGTDNAEMFQVAAMIRGEYLVGQAPFQEQVHIRAFIYDFLWHYAEMVRLWTERTQAEIETWYTLSLEERQQRGLKTIENGASED